MWRGTLALLALVALALLVLVVAGRQPAAPRAGATLPPVVDATLEPLASPEPRGNAVLRVRFAPDRPLPVRLPYRTDDVVVTLADDGIPPDERARDGVYSAFGAVDLDGLGRTLERLARSKTAQPVRDFAMRSKQPTGARLDIAQFRERRRFPWEAWGDPATVDPERSLVIRHPGVVDDPTRTRVSCNQTSMGTWSFGYLMEQMANTPVTGVSASDFTRAWLETWMTNQPVNGWTVNARTLMQERILDPWQLASGGPGAPLDLSKAPFQLVAIVNRIDLRDPVAYGGSGGSSAGELRFVFGKMLGCGPGRHFQIIVEFGVRVSGCSQLKAVAQAWKDLDQWPVGSPNYNAALEAITQAVVAAGADPSKPNGSALNQIRVNENAIDDTGDGLDWEMREYRIDPATHHLALTTLAQTPDRSLRATQVLTDFVNQREASILAGTHQVPLGFPGSVPFRGGRSVYGLFWTWDGVTGGISNAEARHRFALQTCTGCHLRETGAEFSHIDGSFVVGQPAFLSGFMTGITFGGHTFNELERRATDLDALLALPCFAVVLDRPLRQFTPFVPH